MKGYDVPFLIIRNIIFGGEKDVKSEHVVNLRKCLLIVSCDHDRHDNYETLLKRLVRSRWSRFMVK